MSQIHIVDNALYFSQNITIHDSHDFMYSMFDCRPTYVSNTNGTVLISQGCREYVTALMSNELFVKLVPE